MKAHYFDAHGHVQFDDYAGDRDTVLARMREKGVAGVVVGCDAASSETAVSLAEKHDHLVASVGLHPNRAQEEVFDARYSAWAAHPKVVAIGECGLDFFRPKESTEEIKIAQRELFKKHIVLAAEIGKPLIVHGRPSKGTMDAYGDMLDILTEAKAVHGDRLAGDIHFFVGTVDIARQFLALGFTLSFTAVITFARDYDEVIRSIPLDKILAETDAPYLAPAGRRGTRNDPLAVIDVVEKIAEIRGEDVETVRQALLRNTLTLYNPTSIRAV